MYKIKRGDKVIVLVGKDKGKKGTVLRIVKLEREKIKAVVEGINMVKKHKKADPSKNSSGGIVEKEMPMDISNIALLNPKTDKADKVGFKFVEQKKVRYFKSNQEVVVDA
jgi:large subunit ribosomal protein L24